MANKTIKMELSHKSIQDTIKQLRVYQKSLASKNEEFVRRLTELGIPVIDENIALAQGDSEKIITPISESITLVVILRRRLCAKALTFYSLSSGRAFTTTLRWEPAHILRGKILDIQSVHTGKGTERMNRGFIMPILANGYALTVPNPPCRYIRQA